MTGSKVATPETKDVATQFLQKLTSYFEDHRTRRGPLDCVENLTVELRYLRLSERCRVQGLGLKPGMEGDSQL